MTLFLFCEGGALGPCAQCPMVTMSLPRMGRLPGTSNEPPGMRQEAASGHAGKVSLFSHPGIPLGGTQPLGKPARRREGVGEYPGPGGNPVRRAPRAGVQLSKVRICAQLTSSGARVLLNYARALVGLEKEIPSRQTQPQEHSRGPWPDSLVG